MVALTALPLLIDTAAFMVAVRRQQAATDVFVLETAVRLRDGALGVAFEIAEQSERCRIEWPPQEGSYANNPDAVRVQADRAWRSPMLRLRSVIRVSATAVLVPLGTGEIVAGRFE
jgi:hypothetical protein